MLWWMLLDMLLRRESSKSPLPRLGWWSMLEPNIPFDGGGAEPNPEGGAEDASGEYGEGIGPVGEWLELR